MFICDPRDALFVAHERIRHLHDEAAAQRLRPATLERCPLEALLHRFANRCNPAALAHRPA